MRIVTASRAPALFNKSSLHTGTGIGGSSDDLVGEWGKNLRAMRNKALIAPIFIAPRVRQHSGQSPKRIFAPGSHSADLPYAELKTDLIYRYDYW